MVAINKFLKRLFDIVSSGIAIIILIPLWIIIAIAIKKDSKGPIFFKQGRRTTNGKVFHMYKFRSMIVDAEKMGAGLFNYKDDPRVTKIGKLMRKISVDELPQVFNILKGDMSWIGPRPVTTDRPLSEYDQKRKDRLKVKPGITGYTQAYYRNNISQEDKLALDAKYAQKVTFLGDLKIFFKTIETVVCRKNVYTN